MMRKILMVEDSTDLAEGVVHMLEQEGIQVTVSTTILDAKKQIKENEFDCFLVDIGLPDGDGFALCVDIKRTSNLAEVPIFIFSGRNDLATKISAFSLGIDDYMVKPMNLIELRYRVIERLKKFSELKRKEGAYSAGDFLVDGITQRIILKSPKKNIVFDFSTREFKILNYLMRNPDAILSREQILSNVLSTGVNVSDRTIDTHICSIRKKLGVHGNVIESVPGEGYRFNSHCDTSLKTIAKEV